MSVFEQSRRRVRKALARTSRFLVPEKPPGGAVRILMYHRVAEIGGDRLAIPPREFARQMDLLRATGRAVRSLDEAFSSRDTARSAAEPAVVLTFDDGYRDFYDNVFPILASRNLPATVFVVPEFIEGKIELSRYRERKDISQPLTWEMLAEMSGRGITVGSHSLTHRELPGLSREEARREVAGSREAIGRKLGTSPGWFSYPRGKATPELADLVRNSGYRGAVTVRPGLNRPPGDRYLLRRTEISADDDREDFFLKLQGGFDLPHRIWQLLAGRRL